MVMTSIIDRTGGDLMVMAEGASIRVKARLVMICLLEGRFGKLAAAVYCVSKG